MTEPIREMDERYASAIQSCNLRVQADRGGDADLLIAAGWSSARVGSALLRLHSEYDGSCRPRMASATSMLPSIPAAGLTARERQDQAAMASHAHNMRETLLLLGRLRALPAVREQLVIQLRAWSVEEPEGKAAAVLRWWLAPGCICCNGTKYQVVAGTSRHNGKACRACAGAGTQPLPHGQEGRRLANWMDDCMGRARAGMRRHLRTSMQRD